MKKSLVAFAVLSAIAGAASAQSSVTVFGVVDLSGNNWKLGSQSQNRLDSNMMNSNRLGVRGVEDLGGGLSASFHLEGGMDNSMGQGGNGVVNSVNNGTTTGVFAFERKSTVGIAGKFGEIRLGRDYTSAFGNAASFDVYGANGMATCGPSYHCACQQHDRLLPAGRVGWFLRFVAGCCWRAHPRRTGRRRRSGR